MNTKPLGNAGETYAEKVLIKNNYKIIFKNFRCKVGEIDIIAIHEGVLVFVEVKTRMSSKYGFPEEAVTPRKIYKIRSTGEWFVSQHMGLPKKHRIDVVSILLGGGGVIREKIIQVSYA